MEELKNIACDASVMLYECLKEWQKTIVDTLKNYGYHYLSFRDVNGMPLEVNSTFFMFFNGENLEMHENLAYAVYIEDDALRVVCHPSSFDKVPYMTEEQIKPFLDDLFEISYICRNAVNPTDSMCDLLSTVAQTLEIINNR